MKLTFWGAAQTVTGSLHELASNGNRYVLDCGLFQGKRKDARDINANLPFPATSIHAVLLSHAHVDHSGNLPTLYKNGYRGPIYTSPATLDLCTSMLPDSAHLQEKDAEFMAKRKHRRHALGQEDTFEIIEPIYSTEDAAATLPLFKGIPQGSAQEVGSGVVYRSFDAGHMLGSTAMVLDVKNGSKNLRLAFSGDVGRCGLPITRDPEPLPPVDYLIMESTYGDRLHQPLDRVADKLADAVTRTIARGGKIIAPAFAVGRTQEVVMLLHQLADQKRIPDFPIYVDSPLAVNVTEAFRKHTELFDEETSEFLKNGEDPFGFSRLRYIRDVSESKALNDLHVPMMVISASGMCEAGRILHHLRNNMDDPRNTILITGFQAENTLGRKIVDKWPSVNIFGEPVALRSEVVKLNELSGHADQHELIAWMKPLTPGLKKVFLVHGELPAQTTLAKMIEQTYNVKVVIPKRGDSFLLD